MKIKIKPGAFEPSRAHADDAGTDLRTPHDVFINGGGNAEIDTKTCAAIPRGYVGFVKSKSGIMFNKNITTDGVVDAGYTGSINVKLFNHGSEPVSFKAGDKIAQLVVVPCLIEEIEFVEELEETERGENGFGSTGR